MNKKLLLSIGIPVAVVCFIGIPLSVNYIKTADLTGLGSSAKLFQPNTNTATSTQPESAKYDSSSGITEEADLLYPESRDEAIDTETKETDRAKIKSGSISLNVKNVAKSVNSIYELTSSVEGYVVSSNYTSYSESEENYGSIIIKIPSAKFDYTIQQLRSLGIDIISENINIVDIQNELTSTKNQLIEYRKNLEDKYAELEKASASQKSQIQDEIDRLKNQIILLEDTQTQLEENASYSTIDVNLYTNYNNTDKEEETSTIGEVFKEAYETAKLILDFWIKAGVWAAIVIPVVLLPAILLIVVVNVIRRIRKNK